MKAAFKTFRPTKQRMQALNGSNASFFSSNSDVIQIPISWERAGDKTRVKNSSVSLEGANFCAGWTKEARQSLKISGHAWIALSRWKEPLPSRRFWKETDPALKRAQSFFSRARFAYHLFLERGRRVFREKAGLTGSGYIWGRDSRRTKDVARAAGNETHFLSGLGMCGAGGCWRWLRRTQVNSDNDDSEDGARRRIEAAAASKVNICLSSGCEGFQPKHSYKGAAK